jgi:hypothetical protein
MDQQPIFNEDPWIKAIFLLSDLQGWLQESEKSLFYQLPISGKKGLFRAHYYLSARALAHILERHYYSISRHPQCGKFTIPVAEIVNYIRQAATLPTAPVPQSIHLQRVMTTGTTVGFDQHSRPVNTITILTDTGGRIVTAFPGLLST